jgi:nucleoside-diphosphate-sugar epimerase
MNNIFQQYKGAMVLVIGGAGFIGSNLVRHLVDLGAKVTVVDSLFPNYGGNLFNLLGYQEKISFIQKDICNLALAYKVVKNQDFIFNLAGQTSHLDSMQDPFTDQKNNVIARLTIMEACRYKNPQCRIIYTSTRQIYGRPQYLPVDESHPLSPVDFNGVSEIASEHYHNLYHSIFNLPITILRLTNVIGPRMRIKDARQNFVGSWIRKLIEGDEISSMGMDRNTVIY